MALPLFLFSWILLIAGVAIYSVKPQWFEFSRLPDSRWLTWGGLVVTLMAIGLYIWSQMHLRSNFFAGYDTAKKRTLVTTGPYSLVRNPIYVSYCLFAIGAAAFTHQLLPSLIMVVPAVCGAIVVPHEERDLEQAFGQDFKNYKARTGRFLPKLR